ncbi:hypothetical protein CWC22_010770 [Pseudoalteromonas rubra]|uniref:Uncharacterized protein n=1 Tax=Pseudoalteromonas rubra TaxID=43658 RepID=A0A5S3UPT6_9GAMM|nr:hypothetical protein [Pseudoalteromonas rubra]QPB83441.1 hypothetical protein CWC22_010770 [Pseudoalteromonas rubra]
MSTLSFRLCEAPDGRRFACLSDQPEVTELFDLGYTLASRNRHSVIPTLPRQSWASEYSVTGEAFTPLQVKEELPQGIRYAFNALLSELIEGVDVLFCSYALGNANSLPVCDDIMDRYRTTDFVLFPQAANHSKVSDIPPYLVSYSLPRNELSSIEQHRIYCQLSSFAFAQAFQAIIEQRVKAGQTFCDLTQMTSTIDKLTAQRAINRFTECLRAHHQPSQ